MKKQVRTQNYRTIEPSTLDANRALDLVVALMKVPGPSCHEEQIAKQVRRRLTAAGIPAAAITTDNAQAIRMLPRYWISRKRLRAWNLRQSQGGF